MVVIADDNGVEIARRRHGRRAFGLRRRHDRRADRIALCGTPPTSPTPAASSAFHRRALPFRARRRSGFRFARARTGDGARAGILRRRSRRNSSSPANSRAPRRAIAFPVERRRSASPASTSRQENRRRSSNVSASPVEAAGRCERARARPRWRPDIEGKADIVEEIVRIAGLDNVAAAPLPRDSDGVAQPVLTLLQRRAPARAARSPRAGWSRPSPGPSSRRAGANCSAAARRPRARQSDRLRTLRHAPEPDAGPRSPPRIATPRAALPMSLCSRSARSSAARREGPEHRRRGTATRHGKPAAPAVIWSRAAAPSTSSTPRPMRWRCSPRSASPPAAIQIVSGRPVLVLIPAARRRCNSGPRRSSAGFGELHPRALRRSTSRGRSPLSRSRSTRCRRPRRSRPRSSRNSNSPTSSRSRATSPFVLDRVDAGRRSAQGRARRRPRADRRRHASSTSMKGPGVPEGKKSIGVAVLPCSRAKRRSPMRRSRPSPTK